VDPVISSARRWARGCAAPRPGPCSAARRAGEEVRSHHHQADKTGAGVPLGTAGRQDEWTGGGAAWVLPRLTGGATNGYSLCLGVRTNGYLVVGPASGSSSFFLPLFNIKKLYRWCTLGVHFFILKCWAFIFDPTFYALLETCIYNCNPHDTLVVTDV